MSSPATLRTTCIKTTCGFLMSRVWEECEENPFSCMPVSIVQELLSCVWPAESPLSRASIAQSRLLLTSGTLQHVVLPRRGNVGDYVLPLRMLSGGCKNLRTLTIRDDRIHERDIDTERTLQRLLRNCARLEHLHSCICFDPNFLRNCVNLKTLRLHFGREETEMFSLGITPDLLNHLRSVEEFSLCRRPFDLDEDDELILTRAILDNCPQMTSLGFADSSLALWELHDRDLRALGTPRRFQLRRGCFDVGSRFISRCEFCERMRVAALSCPLLEVLVIHVLYPGCLRHLKVLRNLTCLIIDFYYCERDYGQEFYSLLEEIGPQLRYLHVHSSIIYEAKPLRVNVIAGNCPNLRTLDLNCETVVDEGVQSCASLLHLERLSVTPSDRKSLYFLLWNCLHLKVLCLPYCPELEDGAQKAILRKNPFAELKVALLYNCSWSESVWRRFLQSAPKLTSCCLQSEFLDNDQVMRSVRDLNPRAVCHSSNDFYELKKEQFPLDQHCPCWL